jgi:hypothetical protein
VFVAVDDGLALSPPSRNDDRHQFGIKSAVVLGSNRTLMRGEGEFVLLLTPDGVCASQVLCRLDHPAGDDVVHAAGGDAGPVEPVDQFRGPLPNPLPQPTGVVLDVGH